MNKTYSRYKIFGGFGLLLALNGLAGFLTFKVLTASEVSIDKVDLFDDTSALIAYSAIIGLNILFLLRFVTQCKFVITDSSGITFINPLIPIFRKKYRWTDFDYFILVDEYSRYSAHEAVWLIKNKRIKRRFSSFYYSNYHDLRQQINTREKRNKNFSRLGQLLALMRLKRV